MSLQNFRDKNLPAVSAAWLNAVDVIKFTIFGDATTKAQARTALTSDLPLEIVNGGTSARDPADARTALTADAPLEIVNGGTGERTLADFIASFFPAFYSLINPRTPGEIAQSVTPVNFQYPAGDVRRYGADPTGVLDSSAAINTAIDCTNPIAGVPQQTAYTTGGTFRCDSRITVDDNQVFILGGKAQLIRLSAFSASTDIVLHVKGTRAVCEGNGQVWTQNDAPNGIVCCGHEDTSTATYNSLFWVFKGIQVFGKDYLGLQAGQAIQSISRANPGVVQVVGSAPTNGTMVILQIPGSSGMPEVNDNTYIVANASGNTFQLTGNGIFTAGPIDTTSFGAYSGTGGVMKIYPTEGQCIGVRVPSAQPVQGSSATNYFGTIENVRCNTVTTAFWLTDLANGHSLINVAWRGFYWQGLVYQGAYGNRAIVGFCDVPYQNAVFWQRLRARANPGAPFASSLGASRNHILCGTFENASTTDYGCYVDQESPMRQTNNFIEFAFNSQGIAVADASGLNTIIELSSPAIFQNILAINGDTFPANGTAGTLYLSSNTRNAGLSGSASGLPSTPAGYVDGMVGNLPVTFAFYLR